MFLEKEPCIKGHVSWTLRNADGSVADKGSQDNIFTRFGRRALIHYGALPTNLWLLTDETPGGEGAWKNLFTVDSLTPSPTSAAYTNDTPSLTRTWNVSFGSPSGVRTVRSIGLSYSNGYVAEGEVGFIAAYVRLTSDITQNPGQSLEVVYRVVIVLEEQSKSLSRWSSTKPSDELDYAQRLLATVASPWTAYILATYGRNFFFDANAAYRFGSGYDSLNAFGHAWTTRDAIKMSRLTVGSQLAASGSTDSYTGPFGSFSCCRTAVALTGEALHSNLASNQANGNAPLAWEQGSLTNVFKHPSGELALWNVIGSVPLSQGDVEVVGPYRPDHTEAPWHHWYRARIITGGDTDPGTEGTYVIDTGAWGGHGVTPNGDWFTGDRKGLSLAGNVPVTSGFGLNLSQGVFGSVWDGVDSYWCSRNVGTGWVWRWRAGTNEQIHLDVVGDTTRFYGFDSPQGTSVPYTIASNEAGKVFVLERNPTPALQKLFVVENVPGRWYQRPSAAVLTASPQTFTVSTEDEMHLMSPFVVGDVGKKIRTVDTQFNGADIVRTITSFNNSHSVNVDGAPFTTESGMLWHWVSVTKYAAPLAARARSVLLHDHVNNRLWAFTDSGIQVSLDSGVSWSATIDELNGLSIAAAKVVVEQDVVVDLVTATIAPDGSLVWIDTSNAVNRYVGSGPGGTHTRLTSAAMPSFANSYTKGTMRTLIMEREAPDVADGSGAIWIGQDAAANRGIWRVKMDAFNVGAAQAIDAVTIGQTSYLDYGLTHGYDLPGGGVFLWNTTRNRLVGAEFDQSTGVLAYTTRGSISSDHPPQPHVDLERNVLFFFPKRATSGNGFDRSGFYGPVGDRTTLRWDDVASAWRRFNGSAAQFDARYGTSNGGERDLHSSFVKIQNNIRIKFTQSGLVAPADEFRVGESFAFGAAFGLYRTNVDDVSYTNQILTSPSTVMSNEPRRLAATPTKVRVATSAEATGTVDTQRPLFSGTGFIPELLFAASAAGSLIPDQSLYYDGTFGSPDLTTGTQYARHVGIDLNADASGVPEITKLQLAVSFPFYYWRSSRVNDVVQMSTYFSDDNVTWAEATSVRWQNNGAAAPDPGYRFVRVLKSRSGGGSVGTAAPLDNDPHFLVTIDLEAAGLSAGARTHRYWKVILRNAVNGSYVCEFGGVVAYDTAGGFVGITRDNAVDSATDVDFGAVLVTSADFIQDREGLGGKGALSTVDDGDGDGFTNIVTIDSGTFDTGAISTTTDFLSWDVSGTDDFTRRSDASSPGPVQAPGSRAIAKILAATSSQITLATHSVPDDLTSVAWEVVRPATITHLAWPAVGEVLVCAQSGHLMYNPADFGREVRLSRVTTIRAKVS